MKILLENWRKYLKEDDDEDTFEMLLRKFPQSMAELDNYEHPELGRYELEYEVIPAENKVDLRYWLDSKIKHEGPPDSEDVDRIGLEGEIKEPVILDTRNDYTVEGRHRLASALKYGLDVPAIILVEPRSI